VARSILYPELRRLLDDGAQLVEVLPPEEYAEEHLPGATNLGHRRSGPTHRSTSSGRVSRPVTSELPS